MSGDLNKILSENGIEIIANVLEKYSTIQDKSKIGDFLTQILTESNAYQNEAEITKAVNDIAQTIDAISKGYREIQAYKHKGLSSAIWLRDDLDQAVNHLAQNEKDLVVSSVKTAMSNSNNDIFHVLLTGFFKTCLGR
jgi:hypothetical protein